MTVSIIIGGGGGWLLTPALLLMLVTSWRSYVTSQSLGNLVSFDEQTATKDGIGQSSFDYPYYTGDSANVSRLLDQLMRGYDKRLRPNYKGNLVEVGITMFVSSVSSISEANMDFTLDFYFRQHWHDPRLQFTDAEDELCISNEMLAKIWWPDTFFANAKSASFHTATTKNAFLRIKPSGWITQSLRLTVTATCSMDLTYFPMDTQVCSLEIESYAYSVKHIAYKWKDGPKDSVKLDKNVQLPQVKVRGYRVREKLEILTTGNYSRLACEFYFVRSLGYYVIQIYIPSSLIVVLSWVSFWLHRDAAPARVALGITTILTMTTLISSTNTALPKISYLKSIDVYLVTCFVMVFASIVEYAAVSYIGSVRVSAAAKTRPKQRRRPLAVENGEQTTSFFGANSPKPLTAGNIDIAPVALPIKTSFSASETEPIQTEVRLTSMRKLYTECDLRYLSVSGCTGYVAVTPCVGRGAAAAAALPLGPSKPLGLTQTSALATTASTPGPNDRGRCSKYDNISLANAIDRYSRILFPVVFGVLSAMYWIVYIQISPREIDTDFVFID